MAERQPFERTRLPRSKALIALAGLRQRMLGRRQYEGVEVGVGFLDCPEKRLREFDGRERLGGEPVAGLGKGELYEIGHEA